MKNLILSLCFFPIICVGQINNNMQVVAFNDTALELQIVNIAAVTWNKNMPDAYYLTSCIAGGNKFDYMSFRWTLRDTNKNLIATGIQDVSGQSFQDYSYQFSLGRFNYEFNLIADSLKIQILQ